MVNDLRGAVLEEERQVRPGRDEYDEGVERDLAEQERPVVREQVAQRLADERRAPAALVDESDELFDHGDLGFLLRTPHHAGPTAPEKFPAAASAPDASTSNGNCGSGRPAGPNSTFPARPGSKVE